MPDAQKLKRFHIEQDGEDFLLRIEDEAGDLFEVTATHDQVDLIVDSLDGPTTRRASCPWRNDHFNARPLRRLVLRRMIQSRHPLQLRFDFAVDVRGQTSPHDHRA